MNHIKLFEDFDPIHNEFDPYGEEEWNPAREQITTGMHNIYLCTEDDGDFLVGNVYIVRGINQNRVGPNIVDTRVLRKGKDGEEWISIDFDAEQDPFKQSQGNGSLIYIGKLDR